MNRNLSKTKETEVSNICRKIESDFDWNFVLIVSIFIFLLATFFSTFISS